MTAGLTNAMFMMLSLSMVQHVPAVTVATQSRTLSSHTLCGNLLQLETCCPLDETSVPLFSDVGVTG